MRSFRQRYKQLMIGVLWEGGGEVRMTLTRVACDVTTRAARVRVRVATSTSRVAVMPFTSTSLLLAPSSPPSRELTVRILNSVVVVSTHYLRSSTDKLGVCTPLLQISTETISRSYLIRVLQTLSQDAWVLLVLYMDKHGYVGFSVDAVVTRAWTITWMKLRNSLFKSGTKILSDGTFIGIEIRYVYSIFPLFMGTMDGQREGRNAHWGSIDIRLGVLSHVERNVKETTPHSS